MAKVTVEEVVRTDRHRYEVRRIADGVFSDTFQVVRTSGGSEKYIGSKRSLAEAVALARDQD
ncbi:MAG: hypothetical protein ACOYJ6_16570 [Caulobacterales bacterium]|jgi:hypothetical protein